MKKNYIITILYKYLHKDKEGKTKINKLKPLSKSVHIEMD